MIDLFILCNTDGAFHVGGAVHVVLACISHWNNIHLVTSLSKPFCLANLIYCSRTIVIVVRNFSRLLLLIGNLNVWFIIFFTGLLLLFVLWFPSLFNNLLFYLIDLHFLLLIKFFWMLFYIRLLLFLFSALSLQLVFLWFFIRLLISDLLLINLNHLWRFFVSFFILILILLCRLHIDSLVLIFLVLFIRLTLIGIKYLFTLSITARLLLYWMHYFKFRWFYNRGKLALTFSRRKIFTTLLFFKQRLLPHYLVFIILNLLILDSLLFVFHYWLFFGVIGILFLVWNIFHYLTHSLATLIILALFLRIGIISLAFLACFKFNQIKLFNLFSRQITDPSFTLDCSCAMEIKLNVCLL